MHISWAVLQMWKPPTKWKMLTTWWPWAHSPQASWSLRTDNVNTCDTTLFPHHQPVRELCSSWPHTLRPASLTWLLKMLRWNPSGSSELLGHEPRVSLHGPAINLSLLQTPTFRFGLFGLTMCQGHELALTIWSLSVHTPSWHRGTY